MINLKVKAKIWSLYAECPRCTEHIYDESFQKIDNDTSKAVCNYCDLEFLIDISEFKIKL